MKTIMMYQCEKCRKIYDSAIQAMTCEAAHYGLTLEEYYHWMELLKTVKEAGAMNSISKNERTDKAFDDAVIQLVEFEKEYKLV